MINETLVSVIVPAFNVERYLRHCIESICCQTYTKLEILLVDDGSSDGTAELCDELAVSDARIRVIHQSNSGPSAARNNGLSCAHGDWISFVDADDYIAPSFIEALLSAAQQLDCKIVAIPHGTNFQDGDMLHLNDRSIGTRSARTCSTDEALRLLLYQQMETGPQWRLYQRDLLGTDPFPTGIYYEDLACIYRIIHRVSKIALLDGCNLYAYRVRDGGLTKQANYHLKATSAVHIAHELFRTVCEWYPNLSKPAASRCFSVCRMVYAQSPKDKRATERDKCDSAALWAVLARHRYTVLCDRHARKRERLAAAVACCGESPFAAFCTLCRVLGKM